MISPLPKIKSKQPIQQQIINSPMKPKLSKRIELCHKRKTIEPSIRLNGDEHQLPFDENLEKIDGELLRSSQISSNGKVSTSGTK